MYHPQLLRWGIAAKSTNLASLDSQQYQRLDRRSRKSYFKVAFDQDTTGSRGRADQRRKRRRGQEKSTLNGLNVLDRADVERTAR